MTGNKESFYYDGLDRLESVTNGATGVETMGIDYHANGNIKLKTGLGNYEYTGFGPHALSAVDNTDNLIQAKGQCIDYTTFNKAEVLKDTIGTDAYRLDITYGPDQQRWKSVLKKNGSVVKTIIFGGDYEKVNQNGVTLELYYISGGDGLAAVYVKQAGQSDKIYYAHTDHLGSIVSLTDANGISAFKASYDAWGRQTVTRNTIGFHRGYTGHEHLPEFGLIDMNGRMYDPLLGRFLSPDPYVQMPDFSQSFNRYSYCINNPLIYTYPGGELIFTLLAAIIPGAQPLLPFAVAADIGWMTDYGMQVGMNYATRQDGWTAKDIWFKKIDWFDVGMSAVVSGATGGYGAELKAGKELGKFGAWVVKNSKLITLGEMVATSAVDITGEGWQDVSMDDFGKRVAVGLTIYGINDIVGNYTKKYAKVDDAMVVTPDGVVLPEGA